MNNPIQTLSDQIVVFTLEELNYALPVECVLKVIYSVEIRFLPKAPDIIMGIINYKGSIVPVINIRKRFGLKDHEIGLNDRLIIADTGKRIVAILVDAISGLKTLSGQEVKEAELFPFAEHLKGVAKTDDGLILIYDLKNFLDLDEETALDEALRNKKK